MDEKSFPALYQDADEISKRSQAQHFGLLLLQNLALIGGAVLSAVSGPSSNLALASAIVFIGGIVLSLVIAILRLEDEWYRARALAESIKTISWRYMCRAAPYSIPDDDADRLLTASLRELLNEHKALAAKMDGGSTEQITKAMRDARAQVLNDRIAFYVANRIDDQHRWYKRKVALNRKMYLKWLVGLVILQAAAAIISLYRIKEPTVAVWPIDLLSVIAAAVLTWVQAHRYRELSSAYSVTAHDIGLIRAKIPSVKDEADFSEFVGDSENAFSREHTQWLARKDVG
jgi:hypothetical protein